jgi:hypothetical protein
MRFPLVLVFSILTVSCFGAWIYQLNDRIERTEKSNEALVQEIATFDDNLERDVGLLRLANDHENVAKAKLIAELKEYSQSKIEELRLPSDFDSENLTVRTIRSLEPQDLTNRSPIVIQIFNPKSCETRCVISPQDTLSDEDKASIETEVLDFKEPIEFEVPSGLSTLTITTEHNFTRFSKFEFFLNEESVAKIKTVPPKGLSRYFFSGGLIHGILPKGSADIKESGSVSIARSMYMDIRDDFDETRAEIGFRCDLVFEKPEK